MTQRDKKVLDRLAFIKKRSGSRKPSFFLRPGEQEKIEVVSGLDDVVLIDTHRINGQTVLCELESGAPSCQYCDSGDTPRAITVFQIWTESDGDLTWAVFGGRGSLVEAIEQVYVTRGVPVEGMTFLVERLEKGYSFTYQGQSQQKRQKFPQEILRRKGLDQITSWSRLGVKTKNENTEEVTTYDEVPF